MTTTQFIAILKKYTDHFRHVKTQQPNTSIRVKTPKSGEVTLTDGETGTLYYPLEMHNADTHELAGVILALATLVNDNGCLVVKGPLRIKLFSTRAEADNYTP